MNTNENNINFPIPENLNQLKFHSNFQYRNYLTKNGNNILNINNQNFNFDQKCNCSYNQVITPLNNNSPFIYNYKNIKEKPYGYTESDLKNNFINTRLKQYAQDDLRIYNAFEYIYNKQNANTSNANTTNVNN